MDEHGERVDRLGVDQDAHLHEIAVAIVGDLIVEGGVALRDRLQPVIEIEHHLVQRQIVDHHGALADIVEIDLHAAPVLTELQDRAEIVVGRQDRRPDPGLVDLLDLHHIRHVGGIVQLDLVAVASARSCR